MRIQLTQITRDTPSGKLVLRANRIGKRCSRVDCQIRSPPTFKYSLSDLGKTSRQPCLWPGTAPAWRSALTTRCMHTKMMMTNIGRFLWLGIASDRIRDYFTLACFGVTLGRSSRSIMATLGQRHSARRKPAMRKRLRDSPALDRCCRGSASTATK